MWNESSSDEDDQQRRPRTFKPRINCNLATDFEVNERFRMPNDKLEELLQRIGLRLTRNTRRNHTLSPKQVLCTALHWLGNGGQYHGVGDMHGVSKSTVCRAVHQVVSAVNDVLFAEVISWPDNIINVVQNFYQIAQFPSVIGVVDGTLIKIDAPHVNEPQYVDRHGDHSINCMVVCGPDYSFYYVSARWPGSVHDARLLRRSTLYDRMEGGWRPVRGAVILGDSGYPLKEWLMTPVPENPQDPGVRRYNTRHKSTRRIVENSLGILKEKFPCLNYLRVEPTFACEVFKCCTTLCNFARRAGALELQINNVDNDIEEEGDLQEVGEAEDENVDGNRRVQEMLNLFR